jgi:hypothetical protein
MRSAWATALALTWLGDHAADAEGQWRLLAGKARGFLDAVATTGFDAPAWMAAASTFMRTAA